MALFLLRRLVFGLVVLLLVSFGADWFFSSHFYVMGSPTGEPADPWTSYWQWLGLVAHGSFGVGAFGRSLWSSYKWAFLHTAILLVLAFTLVALVGIALGTLAAVRAGTWVDRTLRLFSYLTWGIPAFLLALILQHVLSSFVSPATLSHWPGDCPIPLTGGFYNGTCTAGSGLHRVAQYAEHLSLPAFALATSFIGIHARYLRSSLLVTLNAPYTTTARAKGLSERRIVFRHALRNALVPFVSALLLDFGSIFGASMAVDYVFQLRGVGSAFIGTIADPQIDPRAVQFLLVLTAALVLFTSILTDLAVSWLDPRVQLR